MKLVLRNARVRLAGTECDLDVAVEKGLVTAVGPSLPAGERELDLAGRLLLPGLVNAHDHLDFSSFPPLGTPPYPSLYAWSADVAAGTGSEVARAALSVPLVDRLFLGGLRNLLAGVTAVAHHGDDHRSLGREDFPVRVLRKYEFAHSPGLTPKLRATYRTTDRRIPWMLHALEGTDERCAAELGILVAANLLRQNTVIVHGIALHPSDAPALAAASACVVWCPESNRRLYGATAPVRALKDAGVRIGLGSDSPATGAFDPLSNLAAARAEAAFTDAELLELATRGSAEVARLPVGDLAPGAPADLLAVASTETLLAGQRRALDLVLVAGRPLYGAPSLVQGTPVQVDETRRSLEPGLARRLAGLLRQHPHLRGVPWLSRVNA
jgi:cytosine/adenosine deaminase-related metal-dependent hydrolase